jgi:hypothetical protein
MSGEDEQRRRWMGLGKACRARSKLPGAARGWQFLRGAIGAVSRQHAGFAVGSGFALKTGGGVCSYQSR